MEIPTFGQRDPRWAKQKLNGTASTIGDFGCTISCIAMISGRTPAEQETLMRQTGAFQGDLVLWTRTPGFKQRFYCEKVAAPLETIKAEIRAGRPVLLNVHLGSGQVKANHWVLAVSEDFAIHDPWYGDKAPLCPRYGKTPAIAILGGAYFNPQTNLKHDDMSASEREELNRLRNEVPAKNAEADRLAGEVRQLRDAMGQISEQRDALAREIESLSRSAKAAQDSSGSLAAQLDALKSVNAGLESYSAAQDASMRELRELREQIGKANERQVPVYEMPEVSKPAAGSATLESLVIGIIRKITNLIK